MMVSVGIMRARWGLQHRSACIRMSGDRWPGVRDSNDCQTVSCTHRISIWDWYHPGAMSASESPGLRISRRQPPPAPADSLQSTRDEGGKEACQKLQLQQVSATARCHLGP